MHETDRVVPLDSYRDRPPMSALERALMLDEMEETARAIRARVGSVGDVEEEEARGLEAAIARLRDDLRVRDERRAAPDPMR